MKDFTKEEAIEIQKEQLKKWKSILKPIPFLTLKIWCWNNNKKAKSGYDVKRGTDIDNFLHNLMIKETNKK